MMPDLANGLVQTTRIREAERQRQHELEANNLISEMQASREVIESETQKLIMLSQQLRTHALRNRSDLTDGYLTYSNAYARICGALGQGLRRMGVLKRVLDTAKANQEETKLREAKDEEARRMRAQTKQVERLRLPTAEDFDLVYGTDPE